jgi:HEPN superfamily AbiU2-like protein
LTSAAKSPPKLSQREYASLLKLVSNEVETAHIIYHTHEELNRLALKDEAVFKVLNADAEFWQPYRGVLLQSLFITMSRILDPVKDAITIQKLVTATLANLQLFSKDALRARKLENGSEPWWLKDFLAAAWVPTKASDLRQLQKALTPQITLFKTDYLPIRNAIYAHRLMTDDQASEELFPKTNREGVGKMIRVLQELVAAIQHMYDNGDEPKLGELDPGESGKRIRTSVEKVLRKLANASTLTSRHPKA